MTLPVPGVRPPKGSAGEFPAVLLQLRRALGLLQFAPELRRYFRLRGTRGAAVNAVHDIAQREVRQAEDRKSVV